MTAKTIALAPYPRAEDYKRDEDAERSFTLVQEIVKFIRRVRNEQKLSNKVELQILITSNDVKSMDMLRQEGSDMINGLCRLQSPIQLAASDQTLDNAFIQTLGNITVYIVIVK